MFAMSIPESNMRPRLTYRENFNVSCRLNSGMRYSGATISTGLLQVSACSCMWYGENIQNLETLKDPYKNLSCGARVLRNQIGRFNVIRGRWGGKWRGAAGYWYVIRNTSKLAQVKRIVRETYPTCF